MSVEQVASGWWLTKAVEQVAPRRWSTTSEVVDDVRGGLGAEKMVGDRCCCCSSANDAF